MHLPDGRPECLSSEGFVMKKQVITAMALCVMVVLLVYQSRSPVSTTANPVMAPKQAEKPVSADKGSSGTIRLSASVNPTFAALDQSQPSPASTIQKAP
jgi:hypothetical protein